MKGEWPLSQDAWNSRQSRQSRQNAWRGAHPRAAVEVGKMQSAERIPAGVGIRTNASTIRKSNSVGITAAIGDMGGGTAGSMFHVWVPRTQRKGSAGELVRIRERICDI